VFIILQAQSVVNFGETDIPYPVYVLVGTTLWQLFTESMNAPLNSVKSSKSMLAKINFPREALIISAFYQTLLNLGIKAIASQVLRVLSVLRQWGCLVRSGRFHVSLWDFQSAIHHNRRILYDDITAALPIVTQIWFFLTVVYPSPQLSVFLIATLNPVSPILNGVISDQGNPSGLPLFVTISCAAVVGCSSHGSSSGGGDDPHRANERMTTDLHQ
jgi:lipopolysaccharide transport system permease protein